ncbi:hypothetical protein KVH22_29845 [Streptomyces olivaceus]|uniref:hypothetical protein n=1 Tax=Streptomyces TaxID=1883 RepID=UPI001CCC61FF|nr:MULTISPECIES: hypothetical protein [Streptomyces]MBZ6259722.1 hypothetical protein [Streptomyces olivaceus]MCM8550029.1 hypothetical protein [Streptomyces sp. STCH 565 A]
MTASSQTPGPLPPEASPLTPVPLAAALGAVPAVDTQGRVEAQAELADSEAELRRQLAVMAGVQRQRQAVLRLCEGRRGDDLLLVSAVAVAAECGTTALDGLPMTLTPKALSWDRPVGDAPVERVTIECESSYGGRAQLVVEGDDRRSLATFLDAGRDVHAPCPHSTVCGTAQDLDVSDPMLFGWARLEVAGIDGGPRWYCTPGCVSNALARAADELAVVDDLDAQYGPGASDEYQAQMAEALDDSFADYRSADEDGGL